MKKDKKKLSIKRKVFLGFFVLAVIMLFSSVISLLEFTRMNHSMSSIIEDNVNSINTARELMILCEDYNQKILSSIGEQSDTTYTVRSTEDDKLFMTEFDAIRKSYSSDSESKYADSVLFAYTAYMHVIKEAQAVWNDGYDTRRDWFFNRLQPFYLRLRGYIQQLTDVSQQELAGNSQAVNDTFYRSMMPSIASMAAGLIVVLLFNFFLNWYLLTPLAKIRQGIFNFRKYGKEYTVKIDNEDDLQDLNREITNLITDHKALLKRNK